MATLSERLEELAKRAAHVEQSAAALKSETEEKRDEKIAALKADVESKRSSIESSVKGKGDQISNAWASFNANAKARADSVVSAVKAKKEAVEASHANNRADRLELNADNAVEFALLSMYEAEYAVAEAIDARIHADSLK